MCILKRTILERGEMALCFMVKRVHSAKMAENHSDKECKKIKENEEGGIKQEKK